MGAFRLRRGVGLTLEGDGGLCHYGVGVPLDDIVQGLHGSGCHAMRVSARTVS